MICIRLLGGADWKNDEMYERMTASRYRSNKVFLLFIIYFFLFLFISFFIIYFFFFYSFFLINLKKNIQNKLIFFMINLYFKLIKLSN